MILLNILFSLAFTHACKDFILTDTFLIESSTYKGLSINQAGNHIVLSPTSPNNYYATSFDDGFDISLYEKIQFQFAFNRNSRHPTSRISFSLDIMDNAYQEIQESVLLGSVKLAIDEKTKSVSLSLLKVDVNQKKRVGRLVFSKFYPVNDVDFLVKRIKFICSKDSTQVSLPLEGLMNESSQSEFNASALIELTETNSSLDELTPLNESIDIHQQQSLTSESELNTSHYMNLPPQSFISQPESEFKETQSIDLQQQASLTSELSNESNSNDNNIVHSSESVKPHRAFAVRRPFGSNPSSANGSPRVSLLRNSLP